MATKRTAPLTMGLEEAERLAADLRFMYRERPYDVVVTLDRTWRGRPQYKVVIRADEPRVAA